MKKSLVAALVVTGGSLALVAQVKTNVPDVVPGARPAIVERVKIHGQALEGNLEGDAADRDAIVFASAAAATARKPRAPLSRRLRAARLLDWRRAVDAGNPRASDDRRRVREGRPRDDRRAARLEDGSQRLDVLEFGHDRRLREIRRARCGGVLRRRALPNDREPREPRHRRPFDGRLPAPRGSG